MIGAKKLLSYKKPVGWAGNIKVEQREPQVGDVVKMSSIHVGVVLEIFEDNIRIFDCNFDYTGRCRITTRNKNEMLGYTIWK